MKKNKLLIIIICLPVIFILAIFSIFVYLEVESKKISLNEYPASYKNEINEDYLKDYDLISHELNDSTYYYTLISEFKSDNNLFLSNFYKKDNFRITFKQFNRDELRKLTNHKKFEKQNFSLPNGLYNINYTGEISDITFYVDDYKKINDNLYECNSEFLTMIINDKLISDGIFSNKKFYIQTKISNNQCYLLIYSSSDEKDLYQFSHIII